VDEQDKCPWVRGNEEDLCLPWLDAVRGAEERETGDRKAEVGKGKWKNERIGSSSKKGAGIRRCVSPASDFVGGEAGKGQGANQSKGFLSESDLQGLHKSADFENRSEGEE
jgi:hypothetical protein